MFHDATGTCLVGWLWEANPGRRRDSCLPDDPTRLFRRNKPPLANTDAAMTPEYIVDQAGLARFPFGDSSPAETEARSLAHFSNEFSSWPTNFDLLKIKAPGKPSAFFEPRFEPRDGAPKRSLRVIHIGAGASGIYMVVRKQWSLPYVGVFPYSAAPNF